MFFNKKVINEKISQLRPWGSKSDVLVGLIISSLFINILTLAFPLTLLQVYDRIIPNSALHTLLLLVIGVGIALLLESLLRVARSLVSAWADSRFEHISSCNALYRLLSSKLVDYEEDGAGAHFERLNSVNTMKEFYGGQAIVGLFDLPFVFLFLFLIGYIGGILVLVPIVMLIGFSISAVMLGRKLHSAIQIRKELDDHRLNFLVQLITGIHTIKAMAMEAPMLRRYERLLKSSMLSDHFTSVTSSNSVSMSSFSNQMVMILVVAFGSTMVISGSLSVGGLAACTLLAGRTLQPVSRLMGIWTRLQSITIAEKRLKKIHELIPEDKPGAVPMPTIKGNITMHDVSFRYSDDAPWILDKASLSIKAGETIALQGENESGKTSLLWLLMAGLETSQGEIRIDEANIANVKGDTLRRQIAYLPQKGVLFEGTIMDNITMFRSESTLKDKARALATELEYDSLITHLPRGYETMVGNRAVDFMPRGIAQRICITRALLNDPKIILFDEANISVDRHADAILRDFLEKYKKDKTLIIISYNQDYLSLADKTYRLEKGILTLVN